MRRDFLKLGALLGIGYACAVGMTPFLQAAENGDAKPTKAGLSGDDLAALELGRKVLAIQQALKNSSAPDAMKAVTELGHDSRYYVIVRGWLSQELLGSQSILDAHRGQAPKELGERIAFLKKAIRAIDLE